MPVRVCSENFRGGAKTFMENLQLIVPKATRPNLPTARTTTKSRNRTNNNLKPVLQVLQSTQVQNLPVGEVDEVAALKAEINDMKMKYEKNILKLTPENEILENEIGCIEEK